jgi:hypothetical protein
MDDHRGRYYRDRAAQLLRGVLEEPAFGPQRMAEELAMTLDDLEACRSGRARMPLERQLCLALVVIERVPKFARAGHRLYGHVCATVRCGTETTGVHATPPPGWPWLEPRFGRIRPAHRLPGDGLIT